MTNMNLLINMNFMYIKTVISILRIMHILGIL